MKKASLKNLLRLAKTERRRLVLGSVFLAIASACGLAFPQAIRVIIDQALGAKDEARINGAALFLIVLFFVQGLAIALRYYFFAVAGERVVSRVREELYRSLLSQEIAFFDGKRTGDLTSRLGSDTTLLQSAVSVNISMGLRNTATAVGGVALLFYTSPVLTALMLAIVPAVALGAVTYGRRVRKLSREVQDAAAAANEVAEESLSGIRTVRAFAAEGLERARYDKAILAAFELAKKRIRASSTFMGAASFAAYTAAAVVLWYGGKLVLTGEMSVGQLTSFLLYSMLVAFSLGALGDLWADFSRALGATERIFELMERKPQIVQLERAAPASAEGRVEFKNVAFRYPSRQDVPVLTGLDLSLKKGEVVAVVGPSGAGKSTIASLMTRLYDPDEGQVLFDGQDLKTLDPDWLRQKIGLVSQEPLLFSSTIAENIRYGRSDATLAEVEAAARAANAHDFIMKFPEGYGTGVGERGVQLSGGQKQRVAIARAVLKDPRLLILDEATSALDAESEHLVQEALDRLMKGRTTLVIAHRLSTVRSADRVLVLDGGQVVQSGSHQELLERGGLYKKLVERQFALAS